MCLFAIANALLLCCQTAAADWASFQTLDILLVWSHAKKSALAVQDAQVPLRPLAPGTLSHAGRWMAAGGLSSAQLKLCVSVVRGVDEVFLECFSVSQMKKQESSQLLLEFKIEKWFSAFASQGCISKWVFFLCLGVVARIWECKQSTAWRWTP